MLFRSTSILTKFSNPVLGMLAGAALTAIIQSSSASVGILQALCTTGAVQFATAIPIIMGQNIGTCITAIMSGVGANKNAKRAAAVHLYFNVVGTVLFMVVFYTINAVFDLRFLTDVVRPEGIAIIHSLFNVGATIALFPFARLLERLAILTIPDSEEDQDDTTHEDFAKLDQRFLNNPGFAIEVCHSVAVNMSHQARKAIRLTTEILTSYDREKADKIIEIENNVDKYEDVLGSYLVKLSAENLSQRDSRTLSILLHCIGDFERISDHAVNIVHSLNKMQGKDLEFSKKAVEELDIFSRSVLDIVDISVDVFESGDLNLAMSVEPLEQVIDYLNKEEKQRHIKRLRKGKCTIELGFILTDISTDFERIADHCSNIAVCILQVSEDGFDTHEYLDHLKNENNEEFKIGRAHV